MIEIFVLEFLRLVVIDIVCIWIVCGEKWFNLFCEEVDDVVLIVNICCVFKFGDGNWYIYFSV